MKSIHAVTVFLLVFVSAGTISAVLGKTVDAQKLKTVVIDAGHGGKDPGAVNGAYLEKDVVLKVALKLGKMIEDNYPEVKVIYTRKTDVLIELDTRADIANKAKADLFFSIHANATVNSQASGVETCVMGVDKTNGNMEVAKRENSVIFYEDDYQTRYDGFDPMSVESYIMFSFMQYAYQEKSLMFADLIQTQYKNNMSTKDRGVKQLPIRVLWKSSMPSVLTEIGFISNPTEAKFMFSDDGQEKIVRSLYGAFCSYKSKLENTGISSGTVSAASASASSPAASGAVTEAVSVVSAEVTDAAGLVYRVQVMALPDKIAVSDACFKTYRNNVECIKIGRYYKYYVGNCSSYKDAQTALTNAKRTFSEAFIVPFYNEEIVALDKAKAIEAQISK